MTTLHQNEVGQRVEFILKLFLLAVKLFQLSLVPFIRVLFAFPYTPRHVSFAETEDDVMASLVDLCLRCFAGENITVCIKSLLCFSMEEKQVLVVRYLARGYVDIAWN